jgi:putative ABC transport system substrate-binding protein
MNRRDSVLILAALGATPFVSFAQQQGKVWRIGFLSVQSGPYADTEAFRERLSSLGYAEGRNLLLEYRWAAGKEERLPAMAAELVRLKVDVIVTVATVGAAAAKRATSTIPIVMASVPDPVGSGLVANLARPGGNLTGMSLIATDLAGKRLQLLREVVPKAGRVAILAALKGAPAFPLALEQLRLAAQQAGVTLVVQQVGEAEALAGAFAAMQRERAQAMIVHSSPFTQLHQTRIAELATQHRLPAMYEARERVSIGGLMSYGADRSEMFRRAAVYVDKILKGAKPGDLPVEQPTKFELVINLKTAKAIGITVPQSVLARADEVIQ